ncbi:hypothetical protein [Aeromicrobium sp. Leaf350]|uniref:hypothetical protein n=1 Tax=Aeromicrobium sp. Leaf350 TaxID=2876565 RepID=UPI001E3E6937|nr:hypothetical protein [Aeromicrobium sp. Leaf350]
MDRRASVPAILTATAGQVWPLLALLGTFAAGGSAWWVTSGDPSLVRLAAELLLVAVVGLVGSFAVHESAHLLALRRVPTVTAVRLERTAWRLSLHPEGRMTRRHVVLVALAGPGACLGAGLTLAAAAPESSLRWWFAAHAVFLVPPFGDGRAVLRAILARDPR